MAKDKPRDRKRRRQESRWASSNGWLTGWDFGNPQRQARRDVGLWLRPQLNQIGRAGDTATRDYERYNNRINSLYDIVGKNLAGIGTDMGRLSGNISDAYSSGASDILGGLGQSTAPDQEAYLKAIGSQAMAGQRQLGTMGQVSLDTNQGYREQGELERLVSGRNAAGELRDLLDDYRQQKLDVLAQRPDMLKQRLDELRQLAWERWMAEREWRLRAADVHSDMKNDKGLKEFIESMYGNLPGGGGRGGGGGGGGQGGGGNGGPGGGGGGGVPKSLNRLLSGNMYFNQLGQQQKQNLRGSWNEPKVMDKTLDEWRRLGIGDVASISNPQDLMQLLRQISQQYRTLAQDPNGPGNPGR